MEDGFTPLTLEQAQTLGYRVTLYHATLRNADGSALRARVNGKPKTWKRNPERVTVPMKWGLKQCFYIHERDLAEWSLTEPVYPSQRARRASS